MNKIYWKEYFEKNREKINEYQRNRARNLTNDPERFEAALKYRDKYYKNKRAITQPTFRIIREKRVITISLS